MADNLIVKLGADTSDFRGQISAATAAVKGAFTSMDNAASSAESGGIGQSLRKIRGNFQELKLLITGGGLLTGFRYLFDQAVEYAEKHKDAMDDAIQATLRLKQAQQEVGDTIARWSASGIAAMEKFGLAMGSLVYGTDAAADALNKMQASTQKAMDDELVKKRQQAEVDLAKTRRDIAFQEGDWGKKITILLNEQNRLRESQRQVVAGTVEWLRIQEDIERNMAQQRKVNGEEQKRLEDEKRKKAQQTAEEQERTAKALADQKAQHAAILAKQQAELEIAQQQLAIANKIAEAASKRAGTEGFGGDLGVARVLGGFRSFSNAADQQTYEQSLLESNRRDLQNQIRGIQAQIDRYLSNESQLGKYEVSALRERIKILQQRQSDIRDFVFNPRYEDKLGKGIFASQVETIGDPLGLQGEQTDILRRLNQGIVDINERLRVAGFGTGR